MNEPTSQVDQQLLELVRRKPPEELSPEEIKLLQRRLGESPELREAMAGQLQMEEYLAAALGAVNLPVDDMIKRSGRHRSWSRMLASPLGAILAVLLLVGVLAVVVVSVNRSGDSQEEVVQRDDNGEDQPEEDVSAEEQQENTENAPPSQETTSTSEEDAEEEQLLAGAGGDEGEEESSENGDSTDSQPVSVEDEPQEPPADFELMVEAEDFSEGNLLRDESEFGTTECVIVRGDDAAAPPAFAEYEFEVPAPGEYEFALRYASFDSRPLRATLNGQAIEVLLVEEPTGGWHEHEQRWRFAAPVELLSGQNVLRLEAVTQFPHLDKFSITTPPAASETSHVIAAGRPPAQEPWAKALTDVPRPHANIWHRDFTPVPEPLKPEEVTPWFDDANLPLITLEAELRGMLTAWEDELNGVRVLTPVRIEGPAPEASGEIKFTRLDDGSYLVGGSYPEKGTYTLWFDEDLSGVDTITFEAIGHPVLPNGGPGLSGGSALLTRLRVYSGPEAALTTQVQENGEPAPEYRLAISGAEASHALPGFPVVDCLDDHHQSGWGLDPSRGVDHRARFSLASPIGGEDSGWLRIDMHQEYGASQMFGRFRILASTGEPPEVPAEIREVLNIVPTSRTPEQMAVLVDYLAPRDLRLAVLSERINQLDGEGSALRWALGSTPKGNCPRLEGIGRLRSPWLEEAVLRLELHDYAGLKIHFFHGDEGATLACYGGGPQHWAGYQTHRQPGQSIPSDYQLTASDECRTLRTGGVGPEPLDLRYSQGEIILSRGDIELLRVPLAGVPEDVYLEGAATIAGIDMYRATDFHTVPAATEEIAYASPADREWDETRLGEEVTLERLADGSLRVQGDEVAGTFHLATPLDLLLPGEIVMELSGVSPGMCVYLSQGTQEFKSTINFVEEPGGGKVFAIAHDRGQAILEGAPPDAGSQIAPLVGDHFWIKIVRVDQLIRCWLSVDGVHWGEWQTPTEDFPRQIDHLGFYYRGGGDASLTIHRIEFRPLPGLVNLVDAEILERAGGPPGSAEFTSWLAAVDAERPEDITETAWRQARALRILAQSTTPAQTNALLAYLFDSVVEEGRPIEEQLGVLNATALLVRGIGTNEEALEYLEKYVAVGRRAHAEGNEHPYSLIRQPLMSDPYIYSAIINWGDERLQNWELTYPVLSGDWREVAAICRQWEFLNVAGATGLTEWAKAQATQHLSGGAGSVAVFLKQEWLPPVNPDIDKSLYNQVVELETTVDSDDINAACDLIRRLEPGANHGLAPTRTDPQLHVSLQAAIALTMSRRPEVREVIQSRYGDIAAARVYAAARTGDFEALRLASLQFYGTQAALEASMRLGDRALSAGDFERAISYYREAEDAATGPLLSELGPRIRLTAAFMGQNVGEPVVGQVTLGEASYSAEAFETLVAEMLARAGGQTAPSSDTPAWRPAGPAPAPTAYTLVQRAVFDGPAGANIPNYSFPLGSDLQPPWVERQMATALQDNVLYVNNRFQVSAFNVEDGTRIWQNSLPFGDNPFDMRPFSPMKPVFIPGQVVCRMLTGPTLMGMRQENGQRVWHAVTGGRSFCSDPVIWHEKLYVLVRYADLNRPPRFTLALEIYDPNTGAKLGSVDLVSVWQSSYLSETAQLAVCGNRLVASYEGGTLCLDEDGRVIWLRQHTTMPEAVARYWVTQDQHPVFYENGLLYASLPGMRKIECMELESGHSRWRAVLADLRGIVGMSEGVLLVRTETGFVGYDAETGERLWRTDIENLCEGMLAGGPEGLLCVRRVGRLSEPNLWPQLVWLDPRTGEEEATFDLESLAGANPQIGPIVNLGEKLWLFHAPDQATLERQIYELTPDPALELAERPLPQSP